VSGIIVNTWTRWSSQMVRQLFPMLSLPLADLTPDAVCQIKLHWRTEKRLAEHIATTRGRPTVEQAINDWLHVITDFAAIESDFEGLISPNLMEQARRWLEQQNRDIGSILEKEPEAQASLDQEDYALLLRAYQLRVGPLRKKGRVMSYSHIAIDEVQDFSPIEILILMDICDDAKSFTLAGDTRQHISKEAGFSSWSSFLNQVGLESSSLHTLDISYRSTHPITRFAVQLLEDNEEPLPTTLRDGPSVELFQFSEHGACLIFISEELQKLQMNEPFANVAILTPNADISQMYAAGLQDSDVHKVRLVQNQKFAFAPGIDVVEIDQVKGLEFDYVIVVEVSAFCYPDTPHNRRLLHVGATRAVHQLWLTSCATISPIIKEIL
ncbi:MAG: 3'-5' exonuclease, partial [Myxococcota bacterium]|nr:3'-5' exonuclease [Myxococcota bacterium]